MPMPCYLVISPPRDKKGRQQDPTFLHVACHESGKQDVIPAAKSANAVSGVKLICFEQVGLRVRPWGCYCRH
jgi:hypothetical protein